MYKLSIFITVHRKQESCQSSYRHIWEDYMEICEDIRYRKDTKEIYDLRKETIERTFGPAKENHGMRYTGNR